MLSIRPMFVCNSHYILLEYITFVTAGGGRDRTASGTVVAVYSFVVPVFSDNFLDPQEVLMTSQLPKETKFGINEPTENVSSNELPTLYNGTINVLYVLHN